MARRAISDCFLMGLNYMYIHNIFVCLWLLIRLCDVYIVKDTTAFPGLGLLMGVARNRMHTQALQTSRKKAV